ncbi:excalibur calcium-binding domain-containing protein [Kurthia sibirica]|uniref:Calcium-binding protein n=1 Tax=Kurthia sibirica TaxID=202750 RepID=A0A2U3APQ1_9BACL|nr:excalibur calcium-binding domain-containing protein [Kurthia sibirica]PWI26435.1 calcium-binding protein [Kurthia sibirica]GEK33000.1 hypothetical protein KSI01_05330 [Kurthia sibirica]
MIIKKTAILSVLSATMVLGSISMPTSSTEAEAKSVYSNCKVFNEKYPSGVKKSAATKNKVVKRNGKVEYRASSAKVSASIYKKAMQQNADLDRDKDNIACEK